VSGVFAALGAARMGASVLLVERFGSLGGNMGSQGLMVAGGSGLASQRLSAKAKRFVPSRAVPPSGLMEEFFSRAQRLLPRAETTLPEIANAYSCVAADMARDSGVTLMLSCYAGDPLMDGDRVEGLYVETKSGRVAVRGKVVVDATGNADVAFRAGAPMCLGQSAESVQSPGMNPWTLRPRYRTWDDGGLAYLIGGVDMGRYLAWYRRPVTLSAEDAAWRTERLAEAMSGFQWWKDSVIPLFRLSAEQGGFAPLREIGPRTYTQFDLAFEEIAPGLVKGCASVFGELDAGAWEQVSLAESELRRHILEGVVFLRQHVPGFEKATLVTVAPFLGTRGGRRIEAEVTLTPRQM